MARKNKNRRLSDREIEKLKNIENLKLSSSKPKVKVEPTITYNNITVPVEEILITNHGYERIAQRINIKDKNHALGFIRNCVRKGKIIGQTISEDGTEAIIIGHGRTEIVLSTDLKNVITVTRQEHVTYEPIKKKIAQLHEKEFRKLSRSEQARKRQLKEIKLEAELEIAEINIRLYRTKSQSVKMACQARIAALQQSIEEREQEILELQNTKRHIARSMISVI